MSNIGVPVQNVQIEVSRNSGHWTAINFFLGGITDEYPVLMFVLCREDLLEFAPAVLTRIIKAGFKEHTNTFIRKLSLKLIQRLGLVFLKSKIATWRYQRGSRSLTINLNLAPVQPVPGVKEVDLEEEDYDVPEIVEEVIDELLNGLKDRETVVRWTAAKGLVYVQLIN